MLEYKHDNATFHLDNGGEARIKIAYHGETGYIKVNLLELIGSPEKWLDAKATPDHSPFLSLNVDIRDVCDELKDKVEKKAEQEREKAKAAKSKSKGGKGGGGFSLGNLMKK